MSEDPMFPKTLWPTPDLCPSCHEEQEGLHVWNEQMVLAFLKQHFGASNISPKYTSNSQPEPGPPALEHPKAHVTQPHGKIHLNQDVMPSPENPKNLKRTHIEGDQDSVVQREPRPGMTILGLGFSSVDMSLCVLLYALSCVFLMVMFFFFRIRSKRWKSRNYRPYV